jgi:(p)ppGpp synthase/HD superfamily hydrolase
MRTIKGHSSLDRQKHIANETLLFFVPMAKHFGMSAMAKELEELCLKVLGN